MTTARRAIAGRIKRIELVKEIQTAIRKPIRSATFSRDCRFAALLYVTGDVALFDLNDGRLIVGISGPQFLDTQFSLDGARCIICDAHGASIYEMPSARKLDEFVLLGQAIRCCLSPDASKLAVLGSNCRVVDVIDVHSGETLIAFSCKTLSKNIIFSPEGDRLFVGDRYANISVYDLVTKESKRIANFVSHPICDRFMQFSHDGKWLLVLSSKCYMDVLEAPDFVSRGTYIESAMPVKCAALSPDNKEIAAALSDRLVAIYDIQSRERMLMFRPHHRQTVAVEFSADGSKLVTVSTAGEMAIWDIAYQ